MPFKIIGFSSLKSYFRQVKWKILALFPFSQFLNFSKKTYKKGKHCGKVVCHLFQGMEIRVQTQERGRIYYD